MKKVKNVRCVLNATSNDLFSFTDKSSISNLLGNFYYSEQLYKEGKSINNQKVALMNYRIIDGSLKRTPIISSNSLVDSAFTNGKYNEPIFQETAPTTRKELAKYITEKATTLRGYLFGYMSANKQEDGTENVQEEEVVEQEVTASKKKQNKSVSKPKTNNGTYNKKHVVNVTDMEMVNSDDVKITMRQCSAHKDTKDKTSLFYRESTNGVPCKWRGEMYVNVDALRYIWLDITDRNEINEDYMKENEIGYNNLHNLITYRDIKGIFETKKVKQKSNEYTSLRKEEHTVIAMDNTAMSVILTKMVEVFLNLKSTKNRSTLVMDDIDLIFEYEDYTEETVHLIAKKEKDLFKYFNGKEYITYYE